MTELEIKLLKVVLEPIKQELKQLRTENKELKIQTGKLIDALTKK